MSFDLLSRHGFRPISSNQCTRKPIHLLLLAGAAGSLVALSVGVVSASDSNGNDGGSGESACDEGTSGGCPPENAANNDTVDSGEGEIGQDEDECNNNSGSSNAGYEIEPGGKKLVRPVNWETGEKWETITDLVVRLPGMDYRFTRQYTSDTARAENPYDIISTGLPDCVDDDQISANVGAGWGWSNLRAASGRAYWERRPSSGGNQQQAWTVSSVDLTIYRATRKNRTVKGAPGGAISSLGPGNQQAGGDLFEGELPDGDEPSPCAQMPDAIYYEDPGRWRQTFDLVGGAGWIYEDEDEHGNTRMYLDTNGDSRALPDVILLNGSNTTWNDPDQAHAWIELKWDDNRLVRADVFRPDSTGGIRTQSAIYYHLVEDGQDLVVKYHDGSSYTTLNMPGGTTPVIPHPDLGTAGDLVMVVQEAGTAPGEALNLWRTRVTQYRYHDGQTPPTTGDIRLRVGGDEHQLKSVFMPQQIEAMAQARSSAATPNDETAYEMAIGLLELADTDEYDIGSADLHSAAYKIVSYDLATDRVEWQFIQSGNCGCGSGGAVGAVATSYEWPTEWETEYLGTAHYGQSMFAREYLISDYADWPATEYRSTAYDLLYLRVGTRERPYLWKKAVFGGDIPSGASSNGWVWTRTYDTGRSLVAMGMPSSVTSYTPTESGNAPESNTGSTGLIKAFDYTGESLRSISVGASGALETVERNTYVSSTVTARKNLLATTQRRRVAVSPTADEVEQVTYDYGFDGSGAKLNWRKTSVERELESENGHSAIPTTADSWEFFDDRGQLIVSVDPEGLVTRYEYDRLTGTLTKVTRNYNPGGSPLNWSAVPELDTTGAIGALPTAANSDGALVTEYERDRTGRLVKTTRPGGVESWTVRSMEQDPARPGILYFSILQLPHQVTASPSSYAGPARQRWMDAASQTTRSASWSIDTSAAYDPDAGTYTLDRELSRSLAAQSLNGSTSSTRVWWNIAENLFYETSFTYDELGRSTEVLDGTGTVTQRDYDVLDRVTEVRAGTTAGTPLPVARYYYDGDPGAAPAQGVGNGNLTHMEQLDGVDTRLSRMYYDNRDRLVATVSPNAPMSLTRYDNLDRPIESAVYPEPATVPTRTQVRNTAAGTLAANAASALGQSGAFDRAWYSRTYYSQRGLVYLEETAITPASSSTQFLASHTWYDADGLEVASWMPNSPGTITEYDLHHRVTRSVTTDRGGDGSHAIGTAARFASATSTTGDVVLEQTEYRYAAGSGVLDLVTHRMRHHNASGTGDPTDS